MKKKLCLIISMLIVLFISVANISFAWTPDWTVATQGTTGDAGTTATNIVSTILNVVRIVGTGVSIIMITYVAIKYMLAAPEEKAEFRKSAVGFIVGAVVLFAGSQIVGLIKNFADANITY